MAKPKKLYDKRIDFIKSTIDTYDDLSSHFGDLINNTNVLLDLKDKTNKTIFFVYNNDLDDKNKFSMSNDLFNLIIESDITKNKTNVQWIISVIRRYVNKGKLVDLKMFINEDLPLAKKYLEIFDANKKKRFFYESVKSNYALKHINHPSDITQYKNLSDLFNAVDPFIEKDVTQLMESINHMVNNGFATIPYRDKNYLIYLPNRIEASILFDDFTSWCTATKGNGMFKKYREENKKSDNTPSDIIIIINNKFFDNPENNDFIYQIHFETKQIKNRTQGKDSLINFKKEFLIPNNGVCDYIINYLINNAKSFGVIDGNNYIDYLFEFGFGYELFKIIDEETPIIKIMDKRIGELNNLARFKNLYSLILINCNISDIKTVTAEIPNIMELILTNNKLTDLPNDIGMLKKLVYLNLRGNKIKTIPDSIFELDKVNGGSLFAISVSSDEIGYDNYNKLRILLPTVIFN